MYVRELASASYHNVVAQRKRYTEKQSVMSFPPLTLSFSLSLPLIDTHREIASRFHEYKVDRKAPLVFQTIIII